MKCSNCDNQYKNYGEEHYEGHLQPVHGLSFNVADWTHYDGFSDLWGDDTDFRVALCHDCSVTLCRAIPAIGAFMTGGHRHDGEPCCEFSGC